MVVVVCGATTLMLLLGALAVWRLAAAKARVSSLAWAAVAVAVLAAVVVVVVAVTVVAVSSVAVG